MSGINMGTNSFREESAKSQDIIASLAPFSGFEPCAETANDIVALLRHVDDETLRDAYDMIFTAFPEEHVYHLYANKMFRERIPNEVRHLWKAKALEGEIKSFPDDIIQISGKTPENHDRTVWLRTRTDGSITPLFSNISIDSEESDKGVVRIAINPRDTGSEAIAYIRQRFSSYSGMALGHILAIKNIFGLLSKNTLSTVWQKLRADHDKQQQGAQVNDPAYQTLEAIVVDSQNAKDSALAALFAPFAYEKERAQAHSGQNELLSNDTISAPEHWWDFER